MQAEGANVHGEPLGSALGALLAKFGLRLPVDELWGPVGSAFLDELELPHGYSVRLESLRDRLLDHPGHQRRGKTIAAIFVAEIGDVSRFSSLQACVHGGAAALTAWPNPIGAAAHSRGGCYARWQVPLSSFRRSATRPPERDVSQVNASSDADPSGIRLGPSGNYGTGTATRSAPGEKLTIVWRSVRSLRSGSPEARPRDSEAVPAVIVLVGILALRNVAGEDLVPASLYVPINLGLTAVVALVAARTGMSTSDLGLSRSTARKGLWIGFTGALVVAVTLAVAAVVPRTRPLFEDQRASSVDGGADLAYHTLVRIPLGTVVLEEFAFRGALLSMLGRRRSITVAVVVSSALFGLWHIRPTLSALEANNLASDAVGRFAAVSGAVAFTALAGAAFCALRLASRSLLAPILVHAATNGVSLVIAYIVLGTS